MANNILVLGAGELGTAILKSLTTLAPSTTKISVLLRPSTLSNREASKTTALKALSDLNITFIPGDVVSQSIPELASIFTPFDVVISALGFVAGPGLQLKLARAAIEAKVKRYFPWQFGIDYDVLGRGSAQPLFDEQLDVRDLLRRQTEVGWVILSTGVFMSFLFEEFWGVVRVGGEKGDGEEGGDPVGGVVRALGSWENEVTVTAVEDIGRLTAEIVFADEVIRNEVVHVAGDVVSYQRLADVMEKVLERRFTKEVWTVEELEKQLKSDPENTLKKYRVVFARGKGVAWDMESTFNWKHAIEVTDVESYIRAKYTQV